MTATASFSFPTPTIFGPGVVGELPSRLAQMGVKRPLLVTDAGVKNASAFRKTIARLGEDTPVYADVKPNPTEADVEFATAAFVNGECDCVVGLGGGSVLDVAKIVRVRAKHPAWRVGQDLPEMEQATLAPFIAIPTTAGTGSEVGRSSVITVGDTKKVIFHPALLARLVILDPELTVELPAKLTAATGADALTHCIESYTSPVYHPLCEAIAVEGIRLIARSLKKAVDEPANLAARGDMLLAAMMGGIAFQKDLGAAHSLAHPLSALNHLHHGLANALVLPAVMRFNASKKPGLYIRVGEAMGLNRPTDQQTIDAVVSLLKDLGLASGLRAHGVKDEQLDTLADHAFADGCHPTNAVPVTRDDLRKLYQEAM